MNDWQGKISNAAQVGGIETAVLANGAGRGVRVAWVNTGSPLRYKVVIDRALDLADAFFSQHSLAWISRRGTSAPNAVAHEDMEWLQAFGGGLMTTCGLSHVGGPESDGSQGLHGRVSNTPAELVSVEQPDPEQGVNRMAITGRVCESTVFGPHLEMLRTISGELGEAAITIHDQVTNRGNSPAPHMQLYHCNLGWPLVDEGTTLHWRGELVSRGMPLDDAVFNEKNDYKLCPAPLDDHRGGGESCAFIRAEAEANGLCQVSAFNPARELKLTIEFDPKQLPCLTNWQHWGPGEYVTGLEPGTNFPVGQSAAREQGELIIMEPGESRTYDLTFRVTQGAEAAQ